MADSYFISIWRYVLVGPSLGLYIYICMRIFDLKKEFGLYQISEIKLILVFCSHENNDRFALFCFVLFIHYVHERILC